MTTEKLNLHQKMVEIRRTVEFLKKENQGHGFKFVSSSQTLFAVKEKMDELGVLLLPSVDGHTVSPHTTSGGKSWYFTEIDLEYSWINAEDPKDREVVKWYGQGLDDGEKGVGKAFTYAEKYLMLKTFNIPTDKDDPDASKPPADTKQKPLTDADHKKTVNQMTQDLASKGTTPEKTSSWWKANSKKITDLPKKFQDQITKMFGDYKKKTFVKCPNNKDQVINRDVCEECQVKADCSVHK